MEGRQPPPKAEHPFPNNPDMTKFWGPYSRALFRSMAVVLSGMLALNCVNLYLTRHEKGPLGTDLTITKEELLKRTEIDRVAGTFMNPGMPPMYFEQKIFSPIEMKFDDRVGFNLHVSD